MAIPQPLPRTTSNGSASATANPKAIGNPGVPKHQKENLLMFLKVLIRYLEHKDPQMHRRALGLLRECVRNQRGGAGNPGGNPLAGPQTEGATRTMARRLRALVGERYWKKAEEYARHFLARKRGIQQQQQQANAAAASRPRPPAMAPPPSMPPTAPPQPAMAAVGVVGSVPMPLAAMAMAIPAAIGGVVAAVPGGQPGSQPRSPNGALR